MIPKNTEDIRVVCETILNAHSQDTWAFGRAKIAIDFRLFEQIMEEPNYTARFTRMLYEIHIPLAEQLTNMLDIRVRSIEGYAVNLKPFIWRGFL
jgi:hypothetical protein